MQRVAWVCQRQLILVDVANSTLLGIGGGGKATGEINQATRVSRPGGGTVGEPFCESGGKFSPEIPHSSAFIAH